MTLLRLEFPIDPKPKRRVRVRIQDPRRPLWATSPARRVTVWTPEATVQFEATVKLEAMSQLARLGLRKPVVPSPQPAFVAQTFHLRQPKSGKSAETSLPTTRSEANPDLDNMLKAVWDGLRGVLWTDDTQIISSQETKVWVAAGEVPRIELVVADLEGMEQLVRSESESVIRLLYRRRGRDAASLAASLLQIPIMSLHGVLGVVTR